MQRVIGEPKTPDHIIDWLVELIREDQLHLFYRSRIWRNKSIKVRQRQRECQEHKRRKSYAPPTMVHHVLPLKQYPELALSDYYIDAQGIAHAQLEAECHACHERLEGREGTRKAVDECFVERW